MNTTDTIDAPPASRPIPVAEPGHGQQRQSDVYRAGVAGALPLVPTCGVLLEERAAEVRSARDHAYVAGGAGDGSTMRENRAAFERFRIVPRMLRDVSRRDQSIELFGTTHESPILLAPIGVLDSMHPEADLAVARAAAAERVGMIFSNQACCPMEATSAAMGDVPRWFQLYFSTEDRLAESFVRRAESCGCEAIVLTLDTTMLGWRTQDLDLGHVPFLFGRGIAQYTSDPVFQELLEEARDAGDAGSNDSGRNVTLASFAALLRMARSVPGGTIDNIRSGKALASVRQFLRIYSRPSLTWSDVEWLKGRTDLPIILKGIQHEDDARLAVEHGVSGIVVSNHGGRQVDGAIASLDALPGIVREVAGRMPVLFDSGIRGGADVFKALALGANAVLLGRPYAYGLAIGGEAGVREVIRNIRAELDLTMGLAGCASIDDVRSAQLDRS